MWKKIDRLLSNFEEYLTGLLLLGSTLLLFVNVFLRYVFRSSTTWAEEAIRYALIWVTFIGSSICARRGSHVGIDIFAQMMPMPGKKIILASGQFISAISMLFCVFYSWKMFMLVSSTGQKSPALLMPMSIVYFAMPLGFLLSAIQFVIAGIRALTNTADPAEPQAMDEIDLSRVN